MTNIEKNITALLDKSLQISIIKKNIFDGTLQFLNERGLTVKDTILVEKINKVPIKEFQHFLAVLDDEESYDIQIRLIIKQNLAFLRIEKR